MNLFLYLLHFPVYALGPGRRVGLWLQGCARRCPGCVAPETWSFAPDTSVPLEDVARRILSFFQRSSQRPDGLTISGGEPFDQPEALLELLRRLNLEGANDILIYSGYRIEVLLERHPEFFANPPLLAALVDGPFEEGNVTDSVWKGSDNQGLTIWKREFFPRYEEWKRRSARNLQRVKASRPKGGSAWFLLGIPRQGDVPRLKNPYYKQGDEPCL
ncbi:MAG: radical SAM protein [Synergistaceae bacterium]|nr:radical SAM protein [Synergistaceae bacterium]